MNKPFEPSSFTSRTISEPIAAAAVCPAYPEYIIIGTYSLLSPDNATAKPDQVRNGSVFVLPFATNFKPAYPGAQPPFLDEKCLEAAVLDIHFDPADSTLFGAATSNARIAFFRIWKHANVLARRTEMRLEYLGSVKIAPCNQHGEVPLVTAFTWLSKHPSAGLVEREGYKSAVIGATTSEGNVRIVQIALPFGNSAPDTADRPQIRAAKLLEDTELKSHTEEAWTVATVILPVRDGKSLPKTGNAYLTLSGGDDSAFIASSVHIITKARAQRVQNSGEKTTRSNNGTPPGSVSEPSQQTATHANQDTNYSREHILSKHFEQLQVNNHAKEEINTFSPLHLWTDRKSHTAGVTAILPLRPQICSTNSDQIIPILTGSYDESLRLFHLNYSASVPLSAQNPKRQLINEHGLGGGVWRLSLMDESPPSSVGRVDKPYSALVLASCMHAGVRIIRISYAPTAKVQSDAWKIEVEGAFAEGHDSMVYACDWRTELIEETGTFNGRYKIVSTSFYDKTVCAWDFFDKKSGNDSTGR